MIKSPIKVFWILLVSCLLGQIFVGPRVFAKNKLDLDDLSIKGELQNDDRLNILSREKNELKNYIKFRTHFRTEMIENLPIPAAYSAPAKD